MHAPNERGDSGLVQAMFATPDPLPPFGQCPHRVKQQGETGSGFEAPSTRYRLRTWHAKCLYTQREATDDGRSRNEEMFRAQLDQSSQGSELKLLLLRLCDLHARFVAETCYARDICERLHLNHKGDANGSVPSVTEVHPSPTVARLPRPGGLTGPARARPLLRKRRICVAQ